MGEVKAQDPKTRNKLKSSGNFRRWSYVSVLRLLFTCSAEANHFSRVHRPVARFLGIRSIGDQCEARGDDMDFFGLF